MLRKKCFRCKGSRTIIALGALSETCNKCKGTGYELVPAPQEVDEFLNHPAKEEIIEEPVPMIVEEIKKISKKPGRPARVKQDA